DTSGSESPAEPLPSSATERLVWIGTAAIAGVASAVLGGAVLLACALAAVMIATGAGAAITAIITLA
ncbi:hypothetical protein SB773_34870, partial [Bacillus sp. SIMBA_074]|uniref:hypothetical protein n=1 Tax=Bacillus sp. SIMBA_074 TaxID=3085812 RepID=UPI00397D2288